MIVTDPPKDRLFHFNATMSDDVSGTYAHHCALQALARRGADACLHEAIHRTMVTRFDPVTRTTHVSASIVVLTDDEYQAAVREAYLAGMSSRPAMRYGKEPAP